MMRMVGWSEFEHVEAGVDGRRTRFAGGSEELFVSFCVNVTGTEAEAVLLLVAVMLSRSL